MSVSHIISKSVFVIFNSFSANSLIEISIPVPKFSGIDLEYFSPVRTIPSATKHSTIFSTFYNLKHDEKMEITNDHDPKPLYYQLAAENDGEFKWEYKESGPEVWVVEITKIVK